MVQACVQFKGWKSEALSRIKERPAGSRKIAADRFDNTMSEKNTAGGNRPVLVDLHRLRLGVVQNQERQVVHPE
jgi:hypothetical protein